MATKKSSKKNPKSSSNRFVINSKAVPLPRSRPSNYASASKSTFSNNHLYMYSNPSYTDQELEYFEDAWGSSVAGAVIDKLVEYTFGNGLRPIFELIDDR